MKAQAMRTLTISLSPQQVARLQRAVDTGAYASNSEVVREALRLWEQAEEVRSLELARLKMAYDEGMASGQGREVEADTLLKSIKAKAAGRG